MCFHTLGVGPVFVPITNVTDVINAVDNLRANGGGDCLEMGFTGLKVGKIGVKHKPSQ